MRPYQLDKVSASVLRQTKDICKKSLVLLAQVTLAANTTCLYGTDDRGKVVKTAARDSTGIVRTNRAPKPKACPKRVAVANVSPLLAADALSGVHASSSAGFRAVKACCRSLTRRRRPLPYAVLVRRVETNLQRIADKYTADRLANLPPRKQCPANWRAQVFKRILDRVRTGL